MLLPSDAHTIILADAFFSGRSQPQFFRAAFLAIDDELDFSKAH
jgi:hypothetical protein